MTVNKLSSGYWHVRFNQNQFVQWSVGYWRTAKDTFGFFFEDKVDAACRAHSAVRLSTDTREELRDANGN